MNEVKVLSKSFCIEKISCIRIKKDAGASYSYQSGSNHSRFLYVDCGKMWYHFSGDFQKTLVIPEGGLIFIPAGYPYAARYEADGTLVTIIKFNCISGTLPEELSKPVQLFLSNTEKLIHDASVYPDPADISRCRDLYFTAKTYELLMKSLQSLQDRKSKTLLRKLSPALRAFSESYVENKPIGYYASLCFMNEATFRRSFRKYTGLSPVEYRNKLRMEEADRLIRSGEYSVREAAEAVGCFNGSFFAKTYKNYFGHTPREHDLS